MKSKVTTPLRKDEHNVWVLDRAEKFGYTDGAASEQYLEDVFSNSSDRSTNSEELETRIFDWRSEYHLSRKRAQLLKGFDFDRSLRVLEVGCGCGAITSLLAESFDEVVSVEGTYARAKLTRLRTRHMNNVEVINAPFQEIDFREKFDLIFCIGVFEYSGVYIPTDEPHVTALQQFSDLLTPDGELVLAIENQFGMKYLMGYNEDHTGRPFDGLEGYSHDPEGVRTFGYQELRSRLLELFSATQFYFPYPDYKMPDLVVDEALFSKVNCGDLVGVSRSRDYTSHRAPLFDERVTNMELAKNGTLPIFSNSFLVVASKSGPSRLKHDLAVCFSQNRKKKWSVVTRINEHEGQIKAVKTLVTGDATVSDDYLALNATESPWTDGHTIGSQLYLNARNRKLSLSQILKDAEPWMEFVKSATRDDGKLDGQYIDCVWKNCINTQSGVEFFDREWAWTKPFALEIIVIRTMHFFLQDIEHIKRPNDHLRDGSPQRLITRMARELGVTLRAEHFEAYIGLQCQINQIVYGADAGRSQKLLKYYFWRSDVFNGTRKVRQGIKRIKNSLISRASRVLKN